VRLEALTREEGHEEQEMDAVKAKAITANNIPTIKVMPMPL
jgi:hypothetical protein